MRQGFRSLLLVAAIFLMFIYIIWRLVTTLPSGLPIIVGGLLVGIEIMQAFQSLTFYLIIWSPTKRKPPSFPKHPYTVDILIATYNEPVEILKRTAVGCLSLDYPAEFIKIYFCDDGRRDEVRNLANQLGIGYLTRATNEHAKAGNLNHALARSNGELVVTLDADMVPKPQFLVRTVGFFKKVNTAFVQAPQSFYNEDIFQYNLFQGRNIPNEQDLFMRLIQPGRDRFNAAIYVGSNTVFRRSALDSIGGFCTGTITEDFATGMLLQAKGYRTVYVNEVLAQGLSTESVADFITQRIRWGRGRPKKPRLWLLTVPFYPAFYLFLRNREIIAISRAAPERISGRVLLPAVFVPAAASFFGSAAASCFPSLPAAVWSAA